MTNEQAIERLTSILRLGVADAVVLLFTEDYEAIDYAVKTLEQQPCEDCISRSALINKIEDIYEGYMLDDDGCCPQDFVELAEELPSVTPSNTPERDNSVLERVEDCISREEAIKMFADDDYAVNELRNLASVQPQPKMGRWLEKEVVSNKEVITEWQSARCSVCDKYHTTPYMYYFSHYNYCPNCGKKMVESQESEDKE